MFLFKRSFLPIVAFFITLGFATSTVSASAGESRLSFDKIHKINMISGDTLPIIPDTLKKLLPDSLVLNDSIVRKAKNKLEAKVERSAQDSIVQDLKNKKIFMYNNAIVTYGDIKLEAYYIEFNLETNQVYAHGIADSTGKLSGRPRFTDKTQTFESDEIHYSFDTKKGIINKVVTEDGSGYLHGLHVKKMADNSINIRLGGYTTCNDKEHPHFEFRFNKSKVIPDNKIVTGPAYLVIEDMPTPLAIPFGMFPNKKGQRSGIRIPTYGEAAKRGFYFENGGYYWSINDYLDLDILGDIYTRGSWALKPTLRYTKRYKYNGNLNLSYAINITGVEGASDYQKSRDFRIRWTHQQDPKAHPTNRFSANVNIVSSNFNTFNPVNTESYLSNEFQSSVAYQTNWNNKYFLTLNASHRQNTKTKVVNVTLPSMTFNTNKFNPLKSKKRIGKPKWYEELNLGYTMRAENTVSLPDSVLFAPGSMKKLRNGIQHNIPINLPLKVLKYFSLTNSINITDRMYFNQQRVFWSNDTLFQNNDTILGGYKRTDTLTTFGNVFDYNLSTNLSTKIYGMVMFKKGLLRAVRHVFTPSVGFSYMPDFGNPKWGYYDTYLDKDGKEIRYSKYEGAIFGSPSAGKSGRINFRISNNLEIKIRSKSDTITGMKKIVLIEDFSLSGSYDLARDSLKMSYITMNGRTKLFKNMSVTYSGSWDPYVRDSLGKQLNRFEWTENRRLFRPTQTSWSLGANWRFSQQDFSKTPPKKTDKTSQVASETELDEINRNPDDYVDWSIPWSVTINYNLQYTNNISYLDFARTNNRKIIQTLGVSGDINLTPKWKFSAQTGWDFENKGLSYTSVNIYRDLHCWEMRFSWIPIGPRKSWNFTLSVKAPVLQDLKLTKKKDFRDI